MRGFANGRDAMILRKRHAMRFSREVNVIELDLAPDIIYRGGRKKWFTCQ